jgi:glycosyltransferase involved in cell wall biosynthesis
MMRAQAAEDRALAAEDRTLAVTTALMADASKLRHKIAKRDNQIIDLGVQLEALQAELALRDGVQLEVQQAEVAKQHLARFITGRRVLLGLLRRSASERFKAVRAHAEGTQINLSDEFLHRLLRRRLLFGLARRSKLAREAIVARIMAESLPGTDYIEQRVQALQRRNRQLIDPAALFGLRANAARKGKAASALRAQKEALARALDSTRKDLFAAQAELRVTRTERDAARAVFECGLDPVWNSEQQHFDLRSDEAYSYTTDRRMKPYTIRPATSIDPTALRPKILHVIPNVYIGGSTQLIVDIVERLSDRFEHEVMTSALCRFGKHHGLIVHHVPEASVSVMAELYNRVKPSIIHIHYWGLTDDPWYHAAIDAMAGLPALAIMNINTPVRPIVKREFRAYIFVSEYVRRHFGGEIADPGMTSVIYPGIDLSRFREPYSDPDAENSIGMVYRLEDDKLRSDAIDLFIEVVRRRPRTKVYIIGGGRFLLPYLEKTVVAGVRNNFRFTGYVPYEDLPKWYDRFAIFVAPVSTESFGQVVPFAMRKRAAVAGYNTGALPEILDEADTLGSTLEQTSEIIVGLLNDPTRIREIGRRNERRATALFDVRHMASRYVEVYDRVLSTSSGGPGPASRLKRQDSSLDRCPS